MPSSQYQTASTSSTTRLRKRLRLTTRVLNIALLSLLVHSSRAFLSPPSPFTLTSPTTVKTDSSEHVAVNIERTSSNSRRISGEIIVEKPLDDVWAILTDYDNLSTHVPNLVESRRVRGYNGKGTQGDGEYTCRLYQKGAQKIVGFQFGADVTMNMVESVVESSNGVAKKIMFECVDSLFFSEFDGEWKVTSSMINGKEITIVNYVVDVRPKGPVPVAALEWRIREDVPSNLKAVKNAAMSRGNKTIPVPRQQLELGNTLMDKSSINAARIAMKVGDRRLRDLGQFVGNVRQKSKWRDDETLAAYLPL